MKQSMLDAAMFADWMRENKCISESTIYVYRIAVESFLKKDPDLSLLQSYNDFIIGKTVKKRAGYNYSAIRLFIEYKFQGMANERNKLLNGLIKPPPRNDLKRERRNLTISEILSVVNHLSTKKHKIIALTQYITGLRSGDFLSIKRGDIIIEEYQGNEVLKLIALGKGKKRNVVYVHDQMLKDLILDYITSEYTHEDYYFLELGKMKGREGDPDNYFLLKKSNYQRYWADLKYALNIVGVNKEDFATHDFRRCFARNVWEKEKDVYILQSLLNHSDPKTTLRYLAQSGLKNIDYHKKMQS